MTIPISFSGRSRRCRLRMRSSHSPIRLISLPNAHRPRRNIQALNRPLEHSQRRERYAGTSISISS
jgi:hypothetical protein